MGEMVTGKVKSLREKFGFIRMDKAIGRDTDVFFLPTVMDRMAGVRFEQLVEGQRVECEVVESDRGLRAVSVRCL